MAIALTLMDGTAAVVELAEIHDVQPLGDGCVIYRKQGEPIRAMQSVSWVIALWKAAER